MERLTEFRENKNILMFVTVLVFMVGILAYFNNFIIQSSVLLIIILFFIFAKKLIKPKYILFFLFIFYVGFFNAYLRIKTTDELVNFAPKDVVISGQISSIPNSSVNNKTKFFFNVDKINDREVKGKTLVTVKSEDNDFSKFNIGDSYTLKGKLRVPYKPSNPAQFDYGKYLKNFGAYTVFYTDKPDCKELPSQITPYWKFMQNLNNIRNNIITTHSHYLKSPGLEILGGIVFGDDAVAPPDYIKKSFVNSGLLHILAASGMNVAFIFGFWYFILRRLRTPYKLTVVSGMVVVILYTMMTGLGASVIRAALMLLFILAGKLIDRDTQSVSLLAFVAGIMLLYNPAYINDVGFQLSFLVTFGLLTTANALTQRVAVIKIPTWLVGGILIPIVAQIWVIPIQMFYFNTVSTYSVLANIAIMPFLSIISFGGFVSSVLAMISPISEFICMVFDFVLKYLLDILVAISQFFSTLPNSILEMPSPHVWQILVYYGIVLTLTYMLKKKFTKKGLLIVGLISLLLGVSLIKISNKDVEIISFSVQNADSFLIKTPNNKYFMIDTAKSGYSGTSSQAKYIMLEYMKDMGIKELEGLIITHFDNDHSGGAVDILENRKVNKVYVNSLSEESYTSENIYETLKNKDITTIIPKNNQEIYKEDNFSIKTYNADLGTENNCSIITLVSYKNFDMLFMGDADVLAFKTIKSYLPENIEVLKVGHHGADYVVSPSMLKKLNNKVSIISTGKNNFGHPTKYTLKLLKDTQIYRTDYDNSIKIKSDGKKFDVFTFNPIKHKYEFSKGFDTQAQ